MDAERVLASIDAVLLGTNMTTSGHRKQKQDRSDHSECLHHCALSVLDSNSSIVRLAASNLIRLFFSRTSW